MEQVICVERPELAPVFTGLSVGRFGKLVRVMSARVVNSRGTGRRWGLSLPNRVLLVAVYYRTDLTLRQVVPLFGGVDVGRGSTGGSLGPLLALAPTRKAHGSGRVLIVDGTLVPNRDRSVAAYQGGCRIVVCVRDQLLS